MVAGTDAVVDPSAMVIEPLNTDTADSAVTGSGGTNDLTVGAELLSVKFLKKLNEVNFLVLLDNARVLANGHDVWNDHLDSDHSRGNAIVPCGVVYIMVKNL